MKKITSPIFNKKDFFIYLAILALLLSLILSIFTHFMIRNDLTTIKNSERIHLSMGGEVFRREIANIRNDVLFFRDAPGFLKLLEHPGDRQLRERLQQGFALFVVGKNTYDQIRYLDEKGMEIVRINVDKGKGIIVPEKELQDKSKRYYFTDTIGLDKGQIFFPPLDLNVEQGEIERPFKPMLRVGTPVFDRNGNRRGIILLNYYGQVLLDYFKDVFVHHADGHNKDLHGHPAVLNRDGYWLTALDPQDEWGFMLGNERSFSSRFPEAWSRMQSRESGQFTNGDGLFSFEKVFILRRGEVSSSGASTAFGDSEKIHTEKDYYCLLLSHITAAAFNKIISLPHRFPWLLFFSILLLATPFVWIMAGFKEKNRQDQQALQAKEKRFRLLYDKAPLPYQSLDGDGCLLEVNSSWLNLLGYAREEVIGKSFGDFISPLFRPQFQKNYPRLKERGEVHNVEFELIKKDASLLLISLNGRIAYDREGNFIQSHCLFRDITSQRWLENELVQQTRFLETIVNAVPDIICLRDGEGRWLLANDYALRFFGLEDVAYKGKTGTELAAYTEFYHETFLTCMETDNEAWQQKQIFRVREIFPRPDGNNLVFDLVKIPLFNEDGSRHALVVTGRDITETQQHEEKVKHLNLVLQTIIKVHQEIAAHKNLAPLIQSICEIFVANRGYHSAWILLTDEQSAVLTAQAGLDHKFMNMAEMLKEGDLPKCIAEVSKSDSLFDIPHPDKFCQECPLSNGYRDCGILSAPLKYEGKHYGFLTVSIPQSILNEKEERDLFREVARDIAYAVYAVGQEEKRQAAEQSLQDSEQRYRTLANSLPQRIFQKDRDGVYISCNRSYAEDLGLSPEEIYGKSDDDLFPPEQAERYRTNDQQTMAAGKIEDIEVSYMKNGKQLVKQVVKTPLFDEQGESAGVLGIFWDITERKNMEEMLLQSEKMTTIAGLAAGVAHEINTPLSAVLQSIQVIRQGLDNDLEFNQQVAAECGIDLARMHDYFTKRDINFFLDGIRDSADKAAKIVANLLQFSRPHRGDLSTIGLPALIDNALDLARADYDLKKKYDILNIEVIKEYAADLPEVSCVAMEIEQVVLNLLKNAVQAMADRESGQTAQIILRTSQKDRMVRFEVEDNGPGISEEVRSQIFSPFFTTKEVGEGTGLGLSVSYAIICDKHGGSIRVESEPGQGAKFVVELPLSPPEQQEIPVNSILDSPT